MNWESFSLFIHYCVFWSFRTCPTPWMQPRSQTSWPCTPCVTVTGISRPHALLAEMVSMRVWTGFQASWKTQNDQSLPVISVFCRQCDRRLHWSSGVTRSSPFLFSLKRFTFGQCSPASVYCMGVVGWVFPDGWLDGWRNVCVVWVSVWVSACIRVCVCRSQVGEALQCLEHSSLSNTSSFQCRHWSPKSKQHKMMTPVSSVKNVKQKVTIYIISFHSLVTLIPKFTPSTTHRVPQCNLHHFWGDKIPDIPEQLTLFFLWKCWLYMSQIICSVQSHWVMTLKV